MGSDERHEAWLSAGGPVVPQYVHEDGLAAAERRGYERGVREAAAVLAADPIGMGAGDLLALLDDGQQPGEEG